MNRAKLIKLMQRLQALTFFPSGNEPLEALADLCESMCYDIEQVEWLVKRMTSGIYREWVGPGEMRGCFCGRYKPKDGINAYSTVYPDGLPPDPTAPPRAAIVTPRFKELPPGHTVTADTQFEEAVHVAAEVMALRPVARERTAFARHLEAIMTPPELREPLGPPTPQTITEADIAAAVKKLHEEKARQQAGIIE